MYRQRTGLQEFTRGLLASFFFLVLCSGITAYAGEADASPLGASEVLKPDWLAP